MRTKLSPSLVTALLSFSLISIQTHAQGLLGDSQVVTRVVASGYPEGIATRGNQFYVSGPASFDQPLGSAYVKAYDMSTGAAVNTYPITITNPYAGISGASCAAFGPDGKLYVIEPFVGVIRMNLDPGNTQSVYSAFIPTGPSLLNDLAFGEDGSLYVTDSFAATIYRIPPGGGAPLVWFQDPRLVGDPAFPFGVNGIRVDKNNKQLYVSVTVENDSLQGVIYRLPLVANPTAADLVEFHRYNDVEYGFPPVIPGPDGIAFGKSGKLYVALAGTSQISVLRSDGTEEVRYDGPAAISGGSMPWANPANITFDDRNEALLVTNHASLVPYDQTLFAVFDVLVDDKAQPLP